MTIKEEKIGDFSILKIKGRVDTKHSSELEQRVNKLFDDGEQNVVFNCSKMNYISSSGLRVFLVAQKRAISMKGKLAICNMQAPILEIFRITGFFNLFRIFETLEDAIEDKK